MALYKLMKIPTDLRSHWENQQQESTLFAYKIRKVLLIQTCFWFILHFGLLWHIWNCLLILQAFVPCITLNYKSASSWLILKRFGIEGSSDTSINTMQTSDTPPTLANGLTLQSLATRYISAILQIQPSGPYCIHKKKKRKKKFDSRRSSWLFLWSCSCIRDMLSNGKNGTCSRVSTICLNPST